MITSAFSPRSWVKSRSSSTASDPDGDPVGDAKRRIREATCSLADIEDMAREDDDVMIGERESPGAAVLPRVKLKSKSRRKRRVSSPQGTPTAATAATTPGIWTPRQTLSPRADCRGHRAGHAAHLDEDIWLCTQRVDGEYMQGMLRLRLHFCRRSGPLLRRPLVPEQLHRENPSEQAVVNLVSAAEREGKHVVMAGCVSQGDRNMDKLAGISIVGVSQIDRVVEVVGETLKGNTVRCFRGARKTRAGRLLSCLGSTCRRFVETRS